ncbi:TonB-dependent receptor [Neokomagataea thailandica NBRC 106555]|uniref:TonB-dependent receptor n=2 Tax=Neokomagataea TaxID=1223423 RepID=A0A4Y6VA39_9PROT|nr:MULTISPECIES: TonB-dependent receptor [Neokomagataea]QDH25215.1 TonB-dependent receptor [Neokomagataea tanensis]GBR54067.1 TonB-dependent receptor [Neokomagataea thailandica NBRC 106555]
MPPYRRAIIVTLSGLALTTATFGNAAPARSKQKRTAQQLSHPRDVTAHDDETIAVNTHHKARGNQTTLSRHILEQQVAGTNPLKTLAQTPGVQFQSDDPQGIDTYSVQLFVHGFVQNEIGMTLEGIPLGEPTFRNYNGLNPIQAISAENVERLDVTQGAGAESSASTNNLGGSINYVISRPHDRTGGTIAQTFGSNALYHSFFRFDSGRLNPTGTRFFVSYMRNQTGKWKGGGDQFMQQVNARIVQPIRSSSEISAYFNWDALNMVNYQDYTPNWLQNNGPNLDNFYGLPNAWANAYNASRGIFPAGYSSISDPKDISYYDSTASSADLFGGITADLALTDKLRWKTTFYGHQETGHGTYANPYACKDATALRCPQSADTLLLNGGRIFEQVRRPYIERFGATSSLEYTTGHHVFATGLWYENNQYDTRALAYQQPVLGEGSPLDPFGNFAGVPYRTLWHQRYNTNTFTAYVQDTYHILPTLSLHAGFKSLLNTTRVGDASNWALRFPTQTSGESLTTARAFLPHISADWNFLPQHELFADISENVHAYPQSGYNSSNAPLAVSQTAYDSIRNTLRPETAWTFAGGYRYNGSWAQASLYGYHTNFKNRLQQILANPTGGSLLTNTTATVQNVGGVTMNGVDAGLTLSPYRGLSFFNSFSYNHSVYDQDIRSSGTLYQTKGKQVVGYPQFMYKTRLSYSWKNIETFIDAQYYGSRSYDYVGDFKISPYWMSDLGASYTLHDIALGSPRAPHIQRLVFSFNIYNLANTVYVSTMGQNGFTMDNQDGAAFNNQSILIGAPRQFFGSVRAEF